MELAELDRACWTSPPSSINLPNLHMAAEVAQSNQQQQLHQVQSRPNATLAFMPWACRNF
eukprot:605245-Pelagomonas_calceolata.AAC.7